MFEKLKQLKDLRSQAKTMQSAMAEIKVVEEKNGLSVMINGNMEIIEIKLPENMSHENMEKNLKELINNAVKGAQKEMAKKMQEMGGFGLSDLLK